MNITGTRHDSGDRFDLNMTSMIDCVFLLLIFFVITFQPPKTEGNLPTHFPKECRFGGDTLEVIVGLGFPGNHLQILLNGANLGDSFGLLRRKLALCRNGHPGMRVIIDGSSDVPYDYIVGTLNTCASLGLRKVRFAQPRDGA